MHNLRVFCFFVVVLELVSQVLKCIQSCCELRVQKTVRCAFNSINAVNFGGRTSASVLHFNAGDMHVLKGLKGDQLEEFKELVAGNSDVAIIQPGGSIEI